jgi:predicted Rossmann-fold nucleotide-binding protein
MLDDAKPDLVVAFPGGVGTAGMIKLSGKAGVKVLIIE